MTTVGIFSTVAIVVAFAAYRWIGLRQTGKFDVRNEWPYWLFGIGIIGVSIVLTVAGRMAMLFATPLILIPAGIYMLQRSTAVRTEFGLDWRRTGWLTVAAGVLGGAAVIAALVMAR
jgi:uncharacterized membrane protein